MPIELSNNTIRIKGAMRDASISYLYEAAGAVATQASRNSRVATGKTSGSFRYKVDEDKLSVSIGSDNENAIWEEYGTGEFALKGNGRKGGWSYPDEKGNWHHTKGKKPSKAFSAAFISKKAALIARAKSVIGGAFK